VDAITSTINLLRYFAADWDDELPAPAPPLQMQRLILSRFRHIRFAAMDCDKLPFVKNLVT
jgi:hypothetical protein